MRIFISLTFILFSFNTFSQAIEETIQLDTTSEKIEVVYMNPQQTTYYIKMMATFKDNPAQVAIEKTVNNGQQNGIYKVYYPSGRLKIKTVFANNNINGEWTWYDQQGIILVKGEYKNGIKHGYWAYKSIRTYGKYKKGKKAGMWYKKDENNKKTKGYYKKGVLVKGVDLGGEQVIPKTESTPSDVDTAALHDDGTFIAVVQPKTEISNEYKQAIKFLRTNVVFRKKLKEHFGQYGLSEVRDLKKYFKKGEFQFLMSEVIVNLDISKFIEESEQKKIVVPIIDSILLAEKEVLKSSFDGAGEIKRLPELYDNSTFDQSAITIYFSEIKQHFLRIDVVNYKEFSEDTFSFNSYQSIPQNQKFRILLYFDNNGVLKGAEYEKPSN